MKKYQKILIVIGIVIVAFVAAIIFILSWEGSPKKIVAFADQFQPPLSWKLTAESIKSPRLSCWDGGGCPHVNRGWLYSDILTYDDLEARLKQTDWQYTFDDRCQTMDQPKEDETSFLCVVDITSEDYSGNIYIGNSEQQDYRYRFALFLGPQ